MERVDTRQKIGKLQIFNRVKDYPALFYFTLLMIYFLTFNISLKSALIGWAYFILITFFGKITKYYFRDQKNFFYAWVLPSLIGMGIFQFLWFFSKLLHIHHLIILIPLTIISQMVQNKTQSESNRLYSMPQLTLKKTIGILIIATIFCTAITYFPFKNFGKVKNGSHHYRASFWAVSMKHLAVTNSLSKDYPFENPYFKGEAFHYYFLSYAFPAALKELDVPTQDATFIYHAVQGYLFTLLIFFLFLLLTKNYLHSILLTFILVFTISIEGFYYIIVHFKEFLTDPHFFRHLIHFDGISKVFFKGPLINTFHRAIIYTPMHLQAFSFLVASLIFLKIKRDEIAPPTMIFSMMSSFFIGGIGFLFLFIYLSMNFILRLDIKKYLISFIFSSCFSLGFIIALEMVGNIKGGTTHYSPEITFFSPGLIKLFWTISLNFGFVFLIGILGYLMLILKTNEDRIYYLFLFLMLGVLFFLAFFIKVPYPLNVEIALKLSYVFQLLLVIGLIFLARYRKLFFLFSICIILLGLPTFYGDIYCAQDIHNRHTLRIPRSEMKMAEWIAKNLPKNSVIQTYPRKREWFFSIIPVFAERNTYIGDYMLGTAFQINPEVYNLRLKKLEESMININKPEAIKRLREWGIDYIFFGERERKSMPIPDNLKIVQKIGKTTLYEVKVNMNVYSTESG